MAEEEEEKEEEKEEKDEEKVEEKEEGMEKDVVEVLLMVLLRFWDVFYCFLVKFTDEKELVTDRPTERRTDPLIEMHGRI